MHRGIPSRVFVVSALLSAAPVFAEPSGVPPAAATEQTQSQACAELAKNETELQAILRQILTDNPEQAEFLRKLRVSQRMWLEYRKAHLDSVFPNGTAARGSVQETCECRISAELTKSRIDQLRGWVDGLPESDACRGSRKKAEPK